MDIRAKEIIGLPIVTTDRGMELGWVDDLIVDPARRQVLALVVRERAFTRRTRAIPFGRIAANGHDAVLVGDAKAVLEVDRDPVLKQLDNKQVVSGIKVLTEDGRTVGSVADMALDDHTGEIMGYDILLPQSGEKRWLPADNVVSLGQDVLLVTNTSAAALKSVAVPTAAAGVESNVPVRISPSQRAKAEALAETSPDSSPADAQHATAPVSNPLPEAVSVASNLLGGTTLNPRLLFGIVLIVLGILVLVYPALIPVIAGVSLIVAGLWLALQNAPNNTKR